MNHAFTWCFDYTIVLLKIMGLSFFCFYLHVRAAFTMGEEVGVTFPGSWGA
jgi:uncharacterized protein YybS (DUF2232 family)